jgi:plasmid replication initiation protein
MYNLRKLFIIKPNKLNACVITCNLYEYRIFLFLCAMFQYHLAEKVLVTDLVLAYGCNRPRYASINKAIYELKEKCLITADNESVKLFDNIEYNRGEIIFKFSFEIEEMLSIKDLRDGGYTKYHLKELKRFNSVAKIRMYELLKQYMYTGKLYMSVSKLATMCSITQKRLSDRKIKILAILKEMGNDIQVTQRKVTKDNYMLYIGFTPVEINKEDEKKQVLKEIHETLEKKRIDFPLIYIRNLHLFVLKQFLKKVNSKYINFNKIHNPEKYLCAIIEEIYGMYDINKLEIMENNAYFNLVKPRRLNTIPVDKVVDNPVDSLWKSCGNPVENS